MEEKILIKNKKIVFITTLLCLVLILLCSCSRISVKNESKLKEDLYQSSWFTDSFGSRDGITIDDFQITDRRTDRENKNDTVTAETVIGFGEDSESELYVTVVMEYRLYDNGWMLETVKENDRMYKPLKEPDYSEETIVEKIINEFGGEIEDIEILNPTGSFDEAIYTCDVNCIISHKYMTEQLALQIRWFFDSWGGIWNDAISVINSTEDWSKLAGWYRIDRNGWTSPPYTSMRGFKGFEVSDESITLFEVIYDEGHYSGFWWTEEDWYQYEHSLQLIPTMSFDNFVVMSGFDGEDDDIEEYRLRYGVSVRTQGLTLNDFKYYDRNWLIGKDHIANGITEVSLNVANRSVVYEFCEVELEKIDMDILYH